MGWLRCMAGWLVWLPQEHLLFLCALWNEPSPDWVWKPLYLLSTLIQTKVASPLLLHHRHSSFAQSRQRSRPDRQSNNLKLPEQLDCDQTDHKCGLQDAQIWQITAKQFYFVWKIYKEIGSLLERRWPRVVFLVDLRLSVDCCLPRSPNAHDDDLCVQITFKEDEIECWINPKRLC